MKNRENEQEVLIEMKKRICIGWILCCYWINFCFPIVVSSDDDNNEREPKIRRGPSNISAIVDRNLTLFCDSDGFPAPIISWQKRENSTGRWHQITQSRRIMVRRGSLVFKRLLPSDTAYYRCSAENAKGSEYSAHAYLSVEAPVTFVSRPKNYTVTWGASLELQCEVIGIPFPHRWWTKNGVVISGESPQTVYSNPRLRINATESAKYECLAENSHIEGYTNVSQADYVTVIDGYCDEYSAATCSDFIDSEPVYLRRSDWNALSQREIRVQHLFGRFTEAGNTPCSSRIRQILCHYNFPLCIKAGKSEVKPEELCRESCIAVRDLFCKVEWKMLEDLPDCDHLPSKHNSSVSCVYVDLFNITENPITTSCYDGDGSFYRGPVNVTETGLVCQEWSTQTPNRHSHFPSVYPILEDSGNACRNAGGERERPWCYTTNLSVHWQFCNVARCTDTAETAANFTLAAKSAFNVETGFILATVTAIPITIFILIAVICLRVVLPNIRKPKKKPSSEIDISVLVNIPKPEADYPVPSLRHLEYQRNKVAYRRDISEGAFGNIFLADAPDIGGKEDPLSVVKTLHDKATPEMEQDFIREATTLAQFKHPNILKIFGVCFIGRPWCILLEYMPNGDLNEFLQNCKTQRYSVHRRNHDSFGYNMLGYHEQLSIARQIAVGMVYIVEKGCIHRDLATRNCLVGSQLVVKISDFGLAVSLGPGEDFYQGGEFEPIPIRWSPVESIVHNRFTHASDVWSFGIVLWEIFTSGKRPYFEMTQEEVVSYVRQGKVLYCPENTPSEVYELMRICWNQDPANRPNFCMLHRSLVSLEENLTQAELHLDFS